MRVLIAFLLLASTVFGSTHTIGPDGIDSAATGLDGSRHDLSPIEIGMAELWRAGKAGYDGDELSASNTVPYGVYRQGVGGMAASDVFVVDEHATLRTGVVTRPLLRQKAPWRS